MNSCGNLIKMLLVINKYSTYADINMNCHAVYTKLRKYKPNPLDAIYITEYLFQDDTNPQ